MAANKKRKPVFKPCNSVKIFNFNYLTHCLLETVRFSVFVLHAF